MCESGICFIVLKEKEKVELLDAGQRHLHFLKWMMKVFFYEVRA